MPAVALGQTLLYVPDVEAAAAFYERVFGLSRALVDPAGIYIALAGDGATLAFANAAWVAGNGLQFAPIDASERPPAVEINFFVDDVDATYRAAIEAGATAWFAPAPQPWGQTVAYVRDPAGFLVEIATFPPKPAPTPGDQAPRLRGACHCGNLTLELESSRPIAELGARACTCTFCAPRRMRWTSDPNGRVEIGIADDVDTNRYRFGTGTADFLICRRCGYVVAAVSDGPEPRAVINIDVLDRAAEFPAAEPKDFDAEDVDARLVRRARNWTPATIRTERG
jgi:catechol 2,3-dioxygenase-like lactoylglutathione lyase family enzyme